MAVPAAPTPRPSATPVPVRTIVGRVDSIDRVKGEVVIAEAVSRPTPSAHKAETVVLHVDPKTAVTRGKVPVALDTLLPGDHAVARYVGPPGALRALSIRVADPVRTPVPRTAPPAGPPP
jgi:hypothetical protein